MPYRVTVTDSKITDKIKRSEYPATLQWAKNAAWWLAQQCPHDIVQYEGIRMPNYPTTNDAEGAEVPPILPPWDASNAAQPETEQPEKRTRRRRVCTVEIPEVVHHLAGMTNKDPAHIVQALVLAGAAALEHQAKELLP